MAEDTVIIDLEINDDDATNAIKRATAELVRLKEEQKKLNDEYKAGKKTREEYAAGLVNIKKQMTAANDTIKANEKVLRDNAKAAKEAEGSLNQMRTQLNAMLKQYDSLSKAERENAEVGGRLLQQIQQQTAAVNEAEQSTGRFQRNVGNYPKVFDLSNTSMGKFAAMFNSLSQGTGKLSVAMGGAKQAVAAFGKQLLALLANPIVAAIAAIVVVVMKLVDAFKKSDDAMTSLNTAMAAFQPIVSAVGFVLEKVAETLGKVALGIANVVTAVLRVIPAFKDAQDAAQDYEQSLDKLQDSERAYTVESAKNNRDIAELRAKATDTDKYSAEQRLEFLQQARTLEEKNLKAEKDIAAERLRLARQKAKQDNDTSDETKNRLAELEAAMYQAEENFYQGIRRLDRQAASARNEIAKQEEQALKERQAKYKEYLQKRKEMEAAALQWARAYEDARIEAIADMQQKSEEALRVSYARQIEDLKKTLATEKNLTQQARADIQALIILKEAEMQTKLGEMRKKWRDEQAKKEADEVKKAIAEGYNLTLDQYRLVLEKRLQTAGENAYAAANAMVDYAEKSLAELKRIDGQGATDRAKTLQALGMTETQFQITMVQAENAVADAIQHRQSVMDEANAKARQSLTDTAANYAQAAATISNAMSDLFNAIGEDQEEMSKFLRAVAMVNITVQTAAALAEAVKAGAGKEWPENLAAIASGIAAVLGGIAQATAIMNKANQTPNAPRFADGGLVGNTTTERTDDTVTAKLSEGEYVMRSKSVKALGVPLLDALNYGGGVPVGMDNRLGNNGELREMLSDIVAEIHPEVDVKEIITVTNRVKVKENIARR
jgi:hypothetical protein